MSWKSTARPRTPDGADHQPRLVLRSPAAQARLGSEDRRRRFAVHSDAVAPGALLPPPIPLPRGRSVWPLVLRSTAFLAWWIGATIACVGINRVDPAMIYAATLVVAVGLVAFDFSQQSRGGITCMTVFSLIAVATACANLVGIGEHRGPNHDVYFLYTADEHLPLAASLGLAFAVLPVLGFWAVLYHPRLRAAAEVVPRLSSDASGRLFVVASVVLALSVSALYAIRSYGIVGTEGFLVQWSPNLVAFTLARMGTERRRESLTWLALLVAIVESARAFFFGFLRGDIATPMFAFLSGIVLGNRSFRGLPLRVMAPALLIGALWVTNYALLGEVRGRASGREKIPDMLSYQATRFQEPNAKPQHHILVRLTSFNQLSQIGRLVERDGYYKGETFSYLAVVLVPRFLWPEKPRIALGTWYALRIGQAVETESGWASTSINMTQAGELYLNWGWLGVLIGLPIFGAIYGVIWTRANFWELGARNVLGGALGLIMMWMVLGAHGEFTAVFTLLAVYLVLLALSFGIQVARLCRQWVIRSYHVPVFVRWLRTPSWRLIAIPTQTRAAPLTWSTRARAACDVGVIVRLLRSRRLRPREVRE